MRNGIAKMMNEEVDPLKLDKLAKTNMHIRQRQLDDMMNVIRECGNFFSFVNEAKVSSYAESLQERGIGLYETKKVKRRIIDEYDKFPAFKVFYDLAKSYRPDKKEAEDNHYKIMQQEEEKLLKVEENFNKTFGPERLEKYVEWWIVKAMNWDKEVFIAQGIDIKIFKKPALFDWCDAGYPKNIEMIILEAQKKNNQLKA